MELNCNDMNHTFLKRTKQAWVAATALSAGPSLPQPPAPVRWRNLNACIALLTPVLTLAGCIGPTLLSSQRPITVESLEGDYRRLALCTYERLNRKDGRLRIADSSDQNSVRIDFDLGSSQHWDIIHK
jgi:hypothetical protein